MKSLRTWRSQSKLLASVYNKNEWYTANFQLCISAKMFGYSNQCIFPICAAMLRNEERFGELRIRVGWDYRFGSGVGVGGVAKSKLSLPS